MAIFSESITKVRRLVNDVGGSVFGDAYILALLGRAQQVFCRESMLIQRVVLLKAPPSIDHCVTHRWEEGLVSGRVMAPFFTDAVGSCSQPWEQESGYAGDVTGGVTSTNSVGIEYNVPQHILPLFAPDNLYAPIQLLWNYKVVEEKNYDWVRSYYLDAWKKSGDVVDFFAPAKEGRKKAFYLHGVPYSVQESGVDLARQEDEALLANVFYLFYHAVPDRPSAESDTIDLPNPFIKYAEFLTASWLFSDDTEKRSEIKSAHFEGRYKIGLGLASMVLSRIAQRIKMRLSGYQRGKGKKPPRPKLPDHYPKVTL